MTVSFWNQKADIAAKKLYSVLK